MVSRCLYLVVYVNIMSFSCCLRHKDGNQFRMVIISGGFMVAEPRPMGHHGSDTEDFAGAHSLQQCQVTFQPSRGAVWHQDGQPAVAALLGTMVGAPGLVILWSMVVKDGLLELIGS